MKEYQRKNQWTIPADMWMKTIWTIRGYSRYRDEVDGLLGLSAVNSDGQPHTRGPGDPTFRQAAELMENYSYQMIKIIDDSLTLIPVEYRKGVWNNIQYRTKYPDDAARNTYGHWKQVFVVAVAMRIEKTGHQGKNKAVQ